MSVPETVEGSAWQLLRGRHLPAGSACGEAVRGTGRGLDDWHAWNSRARYCGYHHGNGLKAPVARMVASYRRYELERRSASAEREPTS